MRDQIDEIRARGAELVIVGNGALNFAAAFREDFDLDCPLLIDPELRAYRAAGLRRGRVEVLSPRLPFNAMRALRDGSRLAGLVRLQGAGGAARARGSDVDGATQRGPSSCALSQGAGREAKEGRTRPCRP